MDGHQRISSNPAVRIVDSAARGPWSTAGVPAQVDFGHDRVEPTIAEYWTILARRKYRILLVGVVGAMAALLLSIPRTPIYQARASLEVDTPNGDPLRPQSSGTAAMPSPSSAEFYIATRVEILESRALLRRVVERLKLDARPEFHYSTDRFSAWRKALDLLPAAAVSAYESAFSVAATSYKIVPSRNTGIVEVVSEWPSPRLASDFANAMAEEFIQSSLEARWQAAERSEEWLGLQLDKLRIQLEHSEEDLRRYAGESGLMFGSDDENVSEQRLSQLQAELLRAQAERITMQSRFELVTTRPPDELSEMIDPVNYQIQRNDLRQRLAELETTYTPAHYKVKRLEAQLGQLDRTIETERANRLDQFRNEFESAQRRERLLAADYAQQTQLVSDQTGKSIKYNILNREVESYQQLYDHLLRQVKEAGVLSAIGASNIRIVDPAIVPSKPIRPDHMSNTLLGLLTGLLSGIAFAFIGDRRDRTLREPGDACDCLGLPELGVVPAIGGNRDRPGARWKRSVWLGLQTTIKTARLSFSHANDIDCRPRKGTGTVELMSWQQPPSHFAECFRVAATSILFAPAVKSNQRTFVITSSHAHEGKTTVASNLAITLAGVHNRVLLVDADLRRPRLHQIYEVPNSWGLSNLLQESQLSRDYDVDALSLRTDVPGLFLLPSGPSAEGIATLLHTSSAAELVKRLQQQFDVVIFDSPPVLEFCEARVLGQLSDAVVLVLSAGRTDGEDARAAADRFAEDGTTVLGTILNQWDTPDSQKQAASVYYYRSHLTQRHPRQIAAAGSSS